MQRESLCQKRQATVYNIVKECKRVPGMALGGGGAEVLLEDGEVIRDPMKMAECLSRT